MPTPAFHGPDTPDRALIDQCVHCGFCLPACPTYLLWHEEMDSPRGRIYLMKGAVEGRAALSPAFAGHIDACLGCMACVTACPSGVQYGPLIERTRAQVDAHYRRPLADRLFRAALFGVLPYAAVLRVALAPLALGGGLLRALRRAGWLRVLPRRIEALLTLAPTVTWSELAAEVPELTPARGVRRLTVGFLAGCVQRVTAPQVNQATIRVLAAEGCEIVAPAGQGCCGALSRHAGRLDEARAFARRTIDIFDRTGVDRVIVNAAGCGSSMKEYGELLEGDPAWAARAHAFGARVRDVSEFLVELGTPRAPRHPVEARVAYHDACHLAHAQGIRAEPREVLNGIPGIDLVELGEPDICCGSAGIYNLVQPEAAAALGARKAAHVAAAQPDLIATANPGCALQIAAACRQRGEPCAIVHPIQLVDASIHGRGLDALRVSRG
jgi:glycolate oxidase iron-sulfur subunit